jgi:hypothetical protein
MKLCPQCEFIYEDEQAFCDMDGKELVFGAASLAMERVITPPTRLNINIPPKSRSRSFPILVAIALVLVAILSFLYLLRFHRSESVSASPPSVTSSKTTTSGDTSAPPSQPDSNSITSAAPPSTGDLTQLSEQERSSPAEVAAVSSTLSSAHSASAKGMLVEPKALPNADAVPANRHRPAIIRLNNGSAIKADEVWETREGIWYRQGGMVTMLRRSSVRAIERPGSSVRANSTANSSPAAPKESTAVEPKKESGVTAFLKKTGRILKKPFKF